MTLIYTDDDGYVKKVVHQPDKVPKLNKEEGIEVDEIPDSDSKVFEQDSLYYINGEFEYKTKDIFSEYGVSMSDNQKEELFHAIRKSSFDDVMTVIEKIN